MLTRRAAVWLADRHRRLGAKIAHAARDDFVAGDLQRHQPTMTVANILALLVLGLPVMALALGVVIIWSFAPAILGVAFGGLFLALGVFLWPWREKLPEGVLRRQDLPQTFAMLDTVCAQGGTPPITGVVINQSFNAYVTLIGRERILGFGAVMWAALTDQERLAVLGHEVAHLVNNDPARSGLVAMALKTTNRWLMVLSPDEAGRTGIAAELLLTPAAMLVELIELALVRLLYLQSQRAEYLADALGAAVSGRAAAIGVLEKVALSDLLSREVAAMGPDPVSDPRIVLDRLARAISAPRTADRDRLLMQMQTELMTTDRTHPPTVYRIAFLQSLPPPDEPLLDATPLLQAMILEWDPLLARQAVRIAAALEIQ
jgi:heat shock protein HtpX